MYKANKGVVVVVLCPHEVEAALHFKLLFSNYADFIVFLSRKKK